MTSSRCGARAPRSSGFKIDEVDGYDRYLWPDTARFPSGRDGEQSRQTYGLLVQRLVFDLFRRRNLRTFGQVRGMNAGASRLPFVIYNDNYAFDEYVTAVGNSGFAGVLWSPEVRGGKGEEMLRRTQAVVFSPLALFNGWATDDKLWTHEEVRDDIRAAILLRMRLLPYLYTTFAQYRYEGTPVVRPLQLIEGFKTPARSEPGRLDATAEAVRVGRAVELKDEYMLGDALLVAPIAPGVKTRRVVLPAGRRYDFYTGRTPNEQYTHISLWCLLSAPLLLGNDLEKLDAFTLGLLTNDEVLAVNQEPLGLRGAQRVRDLWRQKDAAERRGRGGGKVHGRRPAPRRGLD